LLPPPNSDESKKFSCAHLAHSPITLPPTLQHTNSPIALLLPEKKQGLAREDVPNPSQNYLTQSNYSNNLGIEKLGRGLHTRHQMMDS